MAVFLMNVIGNTDFIQVIVLIIGGLVVTYTSLNMVSEHFGGSGLVTLQINFSNINQ
jgi:SSS family solute:Na+ symporter